MTRVQLLELELTREETLLPLLDSALDSCFHHGVLCVEPSLLHIRKELWLLTQEKIRILKKELAKCQK